MGKQIPNFFTLLNLVFGCLSITNSFSNNQDWAAYFIGFAAIADFLDGFLAKKLNATSRLGKELDSLADMVSFGVAPAAMLYHMIKYPYMEGLSMGDYAKLLGIAHFACYLAYLITVFSAIRLAKFNVDEDQEHEFKGLPTPANALFISYLFLLTKADLWGLKGYILNPFFLVLLTIVLCYLLVSKIPMFSMKFQTYSWGENKIKYIFLLISLALLIQFSLVGIPLIILLYMILSIVKSVARI
ncbi:MAG: CDP-diacylglycerol--serine O-phosphatidyltransferase [Bacteroidia bacterium]|nr:CDP-diacylglycerol--serine O-phosphatidyltransferase [Bacteroidia bacterium]